MTPSFWHMEFLMVFSFFSGAHLEFPSFCQILDTFEWLVLLPIHVQTTHLETFAERRERAAELQPVRWQATLEKKQKGSVWILPEMASCWILNSMLSEGLSSGFGAPACVVREPRRLGSFWGFNFPTSQTNTYQKHKASSLWGQARAHDYNRMSLKADFTTNLISTHYNNCMGLGPFCMICCEPGLHVRQSCRTCLPW